MMKQEKMNFAQISRTVLWLGLIFCAAFALTARAQVPPDGTVIPTVCFEPKAETFTRTMTTSVTTASSSFSLNQSVPVGFYTLVMNPGGATQETIARGYVSGAGGVSIRNSGLPSQDFAFAHAAGETVLLMAQGDAVFGYHNTSSVALAIPRSVSAGNYFTPGAFAYSVQPQTFQPGRRERVFSIKAIAGVSFTWFLNGGQATVEGSLAQACGTITYQGRLSDAGGAANGQYDLEFQVFDAETDGTSQGGSIKLENVQVTNGVFTVPLFFGSTFNNNFKARYLEIGVRPGSATGNDPFTTLTPRQPLAHVPYAVNAINAVNATNSAQLGGVAANQYLKITGGAINGNLTVNGTINGTATNAAQLGGVPAADYLTNTSSFGQSAATVSGTGQLTVTNATTAYTLVPGLTQIVNVPANSSLLISTDGGIYSQGAINTFSVVDTAIFVDGELISARRIVVSNFAVAASVENWALSHAQTLPAGNHIIEVKVKYGGGESAIVSEAPNSPLLRGKLTVAVIKN